MNQLTDNSLSQLLRRASQVAGDAFSKAATVGDEELTTTQFLVLSAIAAQQGVTQTELTIRTGVDRSTIADLMRRLVLRGLVERHDCKDDSRAYSIHLTDRGMLAVRATTERASSADEHIAAALSDEERRHLHALLKTIVRSSPLRPSAELQTARAPLNDVPAVARNRRDGAQIDFD